MMSKARTAKKRDMEYLGWWTKQAKRAPAGQSKSERSDGVVHGLTSRPGPNTVPCPPAAVPLMHAERFVSLRLLVTTLSLLCGARLFAADDPSAHASPEETAR